MQLFGQILGITRKSLMMIVKSLNFILAIHMIFGFVYMTGPKCQCIANLVSYIIAQKYGTTSTTIRYCCKLIHDDCQVTWLHIVNGYQFRFCVCGSVKVSHYITNLVSQMVVEKYGTTWINIRDY